MQFNISRALEILERTPQVLEAMLQGLSEDWTKSNEGPDTWSPYDVVGHLIHGEKTDWIPRMEIILSTRADKSFEPFDRFAQFEEGAPKTLMQRLNEFRTLRHENLDRLRARNISDNDLRQEGTHPAFGPVTLSQLLATWVTHDLNHIGQISRVMAKQYEKEVGPWKAYLGILKS